MSTIFAPISDDLLAGATVSQLVGTPDADYDLDLLTNGDPADPWVNGSTSAMVLFDLGTAQHIAAFFDIHHNYDPALATKWRGYTSAPTDMSTTAQIEISPKFAVPAKEGDGFRKNIWFDVDAVNPAASYRYWAKIIPTNSLNPRVGALIGVSSQVTLPRWLLLGESEVDSIDVIENKTYGGTSLRAEKSSRITSVSGTLRVDDANKATVVDLFRRIKGKSVSSILIPDTADTRVFLGILEQDKIVRKLDETTWDFDFTFTELSRGLKHP